VKNLFLIRHAKSSWAEIGTKDFDRGLDDRGLRDAPKMAEILKGMGIIPDLIISSPAKRAITTAHFFAKELGIALDKIDVQPDIYEAHEADLLHVVRNIRDDAQTVLLFGHNPSLTYFPNRYTEDFIDNVPTCGIVQLSLNADNWSNFNEKTVSKIGFWYPKLFY
jgi:phosphohistidine phosphatase